MKQKTPESDISKAGKFSKRSQADKSALKQATVPQQPPQEQITAIDVLRMAVKQHDDLLQLCNSVTARYNTIVAVLAVDQQKGGGLLFEASQSDVEALSGKQLSITMTPDHDGYMRVIATIRD